MFFAVAGRLDGGSGHVLAGGAIPPATDIPFALAVKITDHIGKSGKPTKTAARLTLMCVLGVRPCEIKKIKPAKHWNQQ